MSEQPAENTKEDTKDRLVGVVFLSAFLGLMVILAVLTHLTHQGRKAHDRYWDEVAGRATTAAQLDVVGYLRSECQESALGSKNTIIDTKECATEALRDLRVRATPIYVLDKDVKALGLDP